MPNKISQPADAQIMEQVASQAADAVDQLKRVVIPSLFVRPELIGEYCRSEDSQAAMGELSLIMQGAPVTRLASTIGAVTTKLVDADPKRIAEPQTRWGKFTGRAVEVRVKYHVALRELDDLLAAAAAAAQSVRDAVASIDRISATHASEVARLKSHIAAGRAFLRENPTIGLPLPGSITFDNPRERFARKLANLDTLLASHAISQQQMLLTKAQAVDMLDRFDEAVTVLVPVWRHHALSLNAVNGTNASLMAEATKTHDNLMRSLRQSAHPISR